MIYINEIVLNINFKTDPYVFFTIWILLRGKKPKWFKKKAQILLDHFID